jgi:5'-3' exonuclease
VINLIDGDIVAYRCSAACEGEPLKQAIRTMEGFIYDMLLDLSGFPLVPEIHDNRVFLTGKGNFRYGVCADYKAQRADKPKPQHLEALRQHLIESFDASVSVEQEADDDIAIAAAVDYSDCVVSSTDKDFLQLPCLHYNFVKRTLTPQLPWNAWLFFYTQMLTGDRVDNVKGVPGIGPVKAEKLLKDANSPMEMEAIVKAVFEDDDAFLKTGKLLWLRRYPQQDWKGYADV